jgi:hypothetical protein
LRHQSGTFLNDRGAWRSIGSIRQKGNETPDMSWIKRIKITVALFFRIKVPKENKKWQRISSDLARIN